MIVPIGTALACRGPNGVAARGRVVEADNARVRARFDEGPGFAPGDCIEIRYQPPGDRRVWIVGGCVAGHDRSGAVTIAISGESSPENQRSAYRVATAGADLTADIGRQHGCRVLDVSEGGIATELVNPPRPGEVFEVKLHAFGRTVQGRFVLRYATPDRRGPQGQVARCGLQVDRDQPELTATMRQLVMEAQRAQLRNRSRLAARPARRGPPAPASANADQPSAPDAAASETAPAVIRLSLSADKIVGKPMPFSLQDALGRVVIARGEPVDAHIIGRIAAGDLEICEDWSAPDPDAKGAERRVCERRACQTDIRLWLIGPGGVQPVEGEMVDLSRGGAGVRTRGVAHAGSLVVVEFTGRPTGGWIVARVQSSVVAPNSPLCRVGLRFLQSGVQQTPTPTPGEMVQIAESFEPRRRRAQSA